MQQQQHFTAVVPTAALRRRALHALADAAGEVALDATFENRFTVVTGRADGGGVVVVVAAYPGMLDGAEFEFLNAGGTPLTFAPADAAHTRLVAEGDRFGVVPHGGAATLKHIGTDGGGVAAFALFGALMGVRAQFWSAAEATGLETTDAAGAVGGWTASTLDADAWRLQTAGGAAPVVGSGRDGAVRLRGAGPGGASRLVYAGAGHTVHEVVNVTGAADGGLTSAPLTVPGGGTWAVAFRCSGLNKADATGTWPVLGLTAVGLSLRVVAAPRGADLRFRVVLDPGDVELVPAARTPPTGALLVVAVAPGAGAAVRVATNHTPDVATHALPAAPPDAATTVTLGVRHDADIDAAVHPVRLHAAVLLPLVATDAELRALCDALAAQWGGALDAAAAGHVHLWRADDDAGQQPQAGKLYDKGELLTWAPAALRLADWNAAAAAGDYGLAPPAADARRGVPLGNRALWNIANDQNSVPYRGTTAVGGGGAAAIVADNFNSLARCALLGPTPPSVTWALTFAPTGSDGWGPNWQNGAWPLLSAGHYPGSDPGAPRWSLSLTPNNSLWLDPLGVALFTGVPADGTPLTVVFNDGVDDPNATPPSRHWRAVCSSHVAGGVVRVAQPTAADGRRADGHVLWDTMADVKGSTVRTRAVLAVPRSLTDAEMVGLCNAMHAEFWPP